MSHQRSCDGHPKYRAGCDGCNQRSMLYQKRRVYLADKGVKLSAAASVCQERLWQLRANGYSINALSTMLCRYTNTSHNPSQVVRICNGRTTWVQLATFRAIERIYTECKDFPGGDVRAARAAAKRGWSPPVLPVPELVDEEIVDDRAVERVIAGDDSVCLTRAEKVAAWDLLGEQGMSAAERIRFLRVGEASIARWRGGFTRKNAKRTA